MITFLLVISFLLHFITLIGLVVLSIRVSKTKELEVKQEKVARQVEETFTTYLLEIKEENERLMNILEQNGQTDVPEKGRAEKEVIPPEFNKTNEHELESQHQHHTDKQTIADSQEKVPYNTENGQPKIKDVPTEYQKEESYQPSIQSSVFQLFDQGYTIEQIARKLDCGKTEVELMLKIHPKMKQ